MFLFCFYFVLFLFVLFCFVLFYYNMMFDIDSIDMVSIIIGGSGEFFVCFKS